MSFASSEESKNFFEFLDIYYEHSKICDDDQVIDWLEKRGSDPDFWHQTALAWHWESGIEVLHWIALQPTCEMATAAWILIEGLSGGELHATATDCVSSDRPFFEMCKDIAVRLHAGFYTSNRLGFTPQQAANFDQSVAVFNRQRLCIGNPPLWQLPRAAFGPFRGKQAASAKDAVFERGTLRMTMQHFSETHEGSLKLPK
ncbi:hypothetical protein ACRQ1B_14995 [Rhizobium panacihumi]|uniref:hypothetical protein n=1 Tax=Rhizobium panacihumi TaxID=2008450 RepID=UPI003D7BA364